MKLTFTNSISFSSWKRMIFSFVILVISVGALKAEQRAFIVAIGDYPDGSGWSDISSQNDVNHILAALEIVGFKSENIVILRDQEATNKGIKKAFDRFIKTIDSGDQVYVHYSGHGQQIPDDSNEEVDRLDEAIVPYDSPINFIDGVYEGKNLIRDDELSKISKRIRKRLGSNGQLIWVLDSCHSGTGLRGIGKARGTDVIMASKDFRPVPVSKETTMEINDLDSENLSPMLSLFGSSPRELNFETLDKQSKPVGSLSYSISQVLLDMKDPYSFEEFFSRVQQKMKTNAPRQSPQMEGPDNVLLFQGELKANSNSYFDVLERIDETRYKISAGSIADVFEGTKVKLFSRANPELTTKAKVIHSNFNNSIVEIEEASPFNPSDLLSAEITERSAPPIQFVIRKDLAGEDVWSPIVESALAKISYTESASNPDLYIHVVNENLRAETKEGLLVFEILYTSPREEQIEMISEKIRSYLQAKFLRAFENGNSDFDFRLTLEKVDCETEQSRGTTNQDVTSLKVGSCIKFRISNKGLVGGYFTLIDIQPDNVINLVIPLVELKYTASEYYLKPGEEYVTSYYVTIAEPLGEETLKLISSKKPLEIADIIASEGKGKKGIQQLSDFEQQFATSYQKSKEAIIRKNKDALGVTTLYLSIVE